MADSTKKPAVKRTRTAKAAPAATKAAQPKPATRKAPAAKPDTAVAKRRAAKKRPRAKKPGPAKSKLKADADAMAEAPGLLQKFEDMLRGRPTAFDKAYVSVAKKLAEMGATDLDLSQAFGVDVRTIYRWKLEHPAFAEALTIGKDVADKMVENSLFKRAVGYTIDEQQIVTAGGVPVPVVLQKHYPPDVKAATFWLKNRKKEDWRERHEVDHGVQKDNPLAGFLEDISGKAFSPAAQEIADAASADEPDDADGDAEGKG